VLALQARAASSRRGRPRLVTWFAAPGRSWARSARGLRCSAGTRRCARDHEQVLHDLDRVNLRAQLS
jgi:hypothetical protein